MLERPARARKVDVRTKRSDTRRERTPLTLQFYGMRTVFVGANACTLDETALTDEAKWG